MSDECRSPVIVEIGMTRTVGNWLGDGYSTPFFGYLVNTCGGELYSVDIDPNARITCESILRQYGLYTDRVHLIVEDGISFLEKWSENVKRPLDLLYLDGLDYGEDTLAQLSEEFHLNAFKAIEDNLSDRALVLVDDVYDTVTFRGKGRLVIPHLIEKGYRSLHLGYQCLFSKREEYVKRYAHVQLSKTEVKQIADEMIRQVREESLKEGTSGLPRDFGEILLQKEPVDANIRSMLAPRREEGISDDDVRWWWNMDDIERRVIIKLDVISKNDELRKFIEEYGLSEDQAKIILRKSQPIFGNPEDFFGTIGDDRPLPYELMGRINKYMGKISLTDPEKYKTGLKYASTFNAFIRSEIRKGNL